MRRTRNRDAVLDAVVDSFEDGDIDPSVDAIAARAGVSNRSIYRYFADRDDLMRVAVGYAVQKIVPAMALDDAGEGSFDDRVDRFVDHRLTLHRRLVPVMRAAKIASVTAPYIDQELEVGRRILKQTILTHFAEELDPLQPDVRTRAVVAAEVAFQFDAFEFLGKSTAPSGDEMRNILTDHLTLCLGRFRLAHSG